MMFGMGLGWIFLGVVVWAVVRIAGSGQNRETRDRPDRNDAMEILKERYARGEIGKEEFERNEARVGLRRGAATSSSSALRGAQRP